MYYGLVRRDDTNTLLYSPSLAKDAEFIRKEMALQGGADAMYLHATFTLILILCGTDDYEVFPNVRKNHNDHFTSFCYTQDYITTAKESY